MSEQKSSFMSELDQWSEMHVINTLEVPLIHGPDEAVNLAKDMVKKAIRAKVLESYRNGQAAGPRKVVKQP